VTLPIVVALFMAFIVFEETANILGKHFALSGKYRFAVLSLLCFIVCELPWILSLRLGLPLSKGAVLFAIIPSISAVLIGTLVFKEKLYLYQFVGMALGMTAIALLSAG
jgi:multidrug transporter EmrE-like cation transporter